MKSVREADFQFSAYNLTEASADLIFVQLINVVQQVLNKHCINHI